MERRAAPRLLPIQGSEVPARPLLRIRPPARLDRGPGEAACVYTHGSVNTYLGYIWPLPVCHTERPDCALSRLHLTALLAQIISY